jgi:hypothetical protein
MFDRPGYIQFVTSANASVTGQGLAIFKTGSHPNDCSTESSYFTMMPSDSSRATDDLMTITNELHARGQTGLLRTYITPSSTSTQAAIIKDWQTKTFSAQCKLRAYESLQLGRDQSQRVASGFTIYGELQLNEGAITIDRSLLKNTKFQKANAKNQSQVRIDQERQKFNDSWASMVGETATLVCILCLQFVFSRFNYYTLRLNQ